ncbi:MAG TPA: SIMPL domain-containing protein [Thermomicrobiales bacterium]|nr:SIMPL domain-containing protein [Thermomicrobiales bacterium]
MLRRSIVGSAAILALVMAVGVFVGLLMQDSEPEVAAQSDEGERRTVSVAGHGEASVPPDLGHFVVGVEVSNDDPDVALEESNELVAAVRAALLDAGVAGDDVTLGAFSIWPEYDYRQETAVLRGFRVSHQLAVTVRDIDQTGALLSTAVDAGANAVHSVTFSVEDPSAALDEARAAAFENARLKAEDLARLANGSLGQIVSVTENSYTPYPVGRDGAGEAQDSASPVPINPGASTFTVTLQVVWELN